MVLRVRPKHRKYYRDDIEQVFTLSKYDFDRVSGVSRTDLQMAQIEEAKGEATL